MGEVALVVAVGLVTFATRASYLLRRTRAEGEHLPAFLDVFPVALFVALATVGLAAPDGELVAGPSLAAAAGGIVGAALGRRSILGAVVGGTVGYLLARLL